MCNNTHVQIFMCLVLGALGHSLKLFGLEMATGHLSPSKHACIPYFLDYLTPLIYICPRIGRVEGPPLQDKQPGVPTPQAKSLTVMIEICNVHVSGGSQFNSVCL